MNNTPTTLGQTSRMRSLMTRLMPASVTPPVEEPLTPAPVVTSWEPKDLDTMPAMECSHQIARSLDMDVCPCGKAIKFLWNEDVYTR